MSDGPRLPPELERLIFIYALSNTYDNPTNLLLIAKRVQEWLLAILFNIVIIQRARDYSSRYDPARPVVIMPKTKLSLSIAGRFVRHLFISNVKAEGVRKCLAECPYVQDLAIWSPTGNHDKILCAIECLHLTNLSIDPCILSANPSYIGVDNLSTITHLDIAHALPNLFDPGFLMNFRSLTHLALFAAFDVSMLKWALTNCVTLKVIIWLSKVPRSRDSEVPQLLGREPVKDQRVVSIKCGTIEDWKSGARGSGLDMWGLADGVVAARTVRLK